MPPAAGVAPQPGVCACQHDSARGSSVFPGRCGALLEPLLKHNLDGIVLAVPGAFIVRANPQAQRMFRMSEAMLSGNLCRDLTDPDDERFEKLRSERLDWGSASGRVRWRRLGGEYFESECTTFILEVEGSRLACWIIRDVSESRRMEMQSQRWQKIFYGSGLNMVISRVADNTIEEVSPAFALERGYQPEELVGRNLMELRPPELRSALAEQLAKVNAFGRHAWDVVHMRKDGSRFPIIVESALLLDDQGKPSHRIAYTLNMSALKRAEKLTRAVVDGYEAAMALLGPDGVIVLVNKAWRDLALQSGEDPSRLAEGVSYLDECEKTAQSEGDSELRNQALETGAALRRILRGDLTRHALEYSRRIRGTLRWYSAVFTPFRVDGCSHVIVVHHDITDRVEADRNLAEQSAMLEQRAAELDELNTALRVLLNQRERERQELHSQILASISDLILPSLESIHRDPGCSRETRERTATLVRHFESILSPFCPGQNMADHDFSPVESRVASLVRSGLTSKEIAEMLRISPHTVHYYRSKIRRKLDLVGSRQGLRRLLVVKRD